MSRGPCCAACSTKVGPGSVRQDGQDFCDNGCMIAYYVNGEKHVSEWPEPTDDD
ncbi:hypothetical protein [Nocardiopsis dassonvillei]|uniref:hypothetical protein n=1 Tax=Nocardiopsis dassonvillei TaxID=2014 RepID=UPI003631F73F